MPTKTVEISDDNGDAYTVDFPATYEVCDRCQGEGKHVNPNVDGHGITAEEWAEEWDEESREGYMSGRYDVRCEQCHGQRVTLEIDESAITVNHPLAQDLQAYHEQQARRAQWDAEDRHTRRMESGGYD